MFSALIKFVRVISSEAEPIQISLAFGLAMIAGLTPLLNMHNLLVLLLLLVLRVNIASFMLALAVFSGAAYLLDPLFHSVGATILNSASLAATFTEMYNNTFWRLANFNNTIVMGSLSITLLLFVPFVLISNILVKRYRSHVLSYMQNSRLFNFVRQSKLFGKMVSMAE